MKHLTRLTFLALIPAAMASLAGAQTSQALRDTGFPAMNDPCLECGTMAAPYKLVAAAARDERFTSGSRAYSTSHYIPKTALLAKSVITFSSRSPQISLWR
jgi:hypothetical protein